MARSLASALADVLGPEHVLTDRDVITSYETDWTGRFRGDARFVARPGDAGEVAAVLTACAERGVAVVPQGGNTGLVGGSVPRPSGGAATDAAVVLSLRRLDTLGDVDREAMQVTAGAGVTLSDWRQRARAAGLDTPVDFASRDSATIGGAVATNAGGSRVLRFGTMRAQVAGIEAVRTDGSIVGSLSGLPKETVGLHWPSVLAGSEGTLAVVTRARLALVPWYRDVATALVATDGVAAAVSLAGHLRAHVPSLDSLELILPEAMALVTAHLATGLPVRASGAYVLVECAAHGDPTDELLDALAGADGVRDTAIAVGGPARDRLVALRDRITESIAAAGVPLKLDVAVPVAALDVLAAEATATVERFGGRLIIFGHLAEGNLHLNTLDPGDVEGIAEAVLATVSRLGGTISAEHGVGIAKTPWLHLVRSGAELAAAAAVRRALDPAGILNPGVLEPR